MVTRLYPISQDDLRLKDDTDRRYIPGYEIRYIDSENESYPYVRAAFVEVPYSLIDTDIEAQVPTATAVLTETVYNAVYDEIYRLMYEFWTDILEDNEFSYTGTSSFDISLIPEFVQANIKDVSEAVANNVLGTSLDNVYVAHPGLRSWLTNAIRAGMDWISEIDLPEKGWIENQDSSYSYGTDLRNLKNEWAYIDRKMSYFNNNEKWEKKKDDSYEWDWVQKKGQRKKFGNNKRYLARNTYVYDYDGGCKYYWFDEEGWWDGTSESSGWAWHQDSTGWWFGDADPDGDDSKYIHDDWAFIRETADSPRKLYYFDSDGYLDGEEVVDWNWHKVNGKWYFGSTNHENRATYLVSQWMQIEGDWRLFDSNGYVEDLETTKAALISALSIYLQEEAGSLIATEQNALFDLLYSNMEEYCKDLYDNGLDKPSINVSVDFVDLSKTQEYAAYSNLEKICLGDDVEVHDPVHGIDAITERVMGLTYDCIRGYNTKIEVGGVSSVTSLFDTSVKGTGNEQRLVAGENVTINGNVINVSANTGDVYAGDRVSVTQLQTTGQPIAKIYVNGTPTTIYAVGSDVEVEPIKTEGDKIATITVGGEDYDIYADTGLKWWTETQTDIYRTGTREGLTCDAEYYLNNTVICNANRYHFRKVNTKPVVAGHSNRRICEVIMLSPDQDALGWEYEYYWNDEVGWMHYGTGWMDRISGYGAPRQWDSSTGTSTSTWATIRDFDFTYNGVHWYGTYFCIQAETSGFTFPFNTYNHDLITPYNDLSGMIDEAKTLIDTANATTSIVDIVGISNQDHILYYNNDKAHNYDTENRDDAVYISKDGIFNGSEFRVNGVAIGSFYKTRLYLGSSYAASITLSDSYTAYDLLMIETYNQDDKKNLASMVNVSDLANSSYVGVDGYLMYTITNGRTLTFHEAPTDTNHSRYIKAIYGLRTGHDSGTESPIEDVTVDGESVVSGGVAVIDLSSKQDALTAGNNVQISNQGVISATDTTYSDFTGSSHGLVPSASSGDSSKYLKGDGTWGTPDTGTTYTAGANIQISEQNVISATDTTYSDFDGTNSGLVPEPQSGDSGYLKSDGTWDEPEGTTVIANPSGTAIDTLTKIQVENTIYDIASGSYIEVATSILQSYTEWTEKYTSGMVAYYSSDKIYFATASYTDSDRAMAVYKVQIPASVKKIRYSITQKRTDAQDPTQDMYKLCVGVKSSYDDVNYSTPTDSDFLVKNLHEFETYNVVTNGELDISSISSTVYLYIIANGFGCEVTKVEIIEYKAGLEDLSDVDISNPSNGQVLTYDSNNQKWVNANASGGTTVVANPSGSATDNLLKLQVGNTIYNSALSYSTTEQVVGTWHDGREIYQKSYVMSNFRVNANVTFNHNISNLDQIISFEGSMKSTRDSGYITAFMPMEVTSTSTTLKIVKVMEEWYAQTYREWTFTIKYLKTSS